MAGELVMDAHCVTCGYALRGLSEYRCPECGRAFDPLDPRTVRRAGALRQYGVHLRNLATCRWHRLAGPPTRRVMIEIWCLAIGLSLGSGLLHVGRGEIFFLVDMTLFPRWVQSLPFGLGRLGPRFIAVWYPWFALVLVAGWYGIFRPVMAWRFHKKNPTEIRSGPLRRWRGVQVAAALIGLSLAYPWGMYARLLPARAALQRAAEAQLALGVGTEQPRWVGGWYVRGIYIYNDHSVLLHTHRVWSRRGWFRSGFLYHPPSLGRRSTFAYLPLDRTWSLGLVP